MKAGLMRDSAIFQEPEETRGASGEVVMWWENVATKFVQERGIGIEEREAIVHKIEGEVKRFSTHFFDGITIQGRMLYGEMAYQIEALVDRDFKHRDLDLYVRTDAAFYPLFSYQYLATQGISAGSYEFTWLTDAFATSRVRHREVGTVPWTYSTHLATRSLSHSIASSGFAAGKTYEFQAYGENLQGKSPGYSASKQWVVPGAGALHIMGVSFDTAVKGRIGISYSTSEAAKCTVYGTPYPVDEIFESWYVNAVEHASHAHAKTGLALGANYAVNVQCTTDGGLTAWAPTALGYFVVRTSDDGGGSGGLIKTVM